LPEIVAAYRDSAYGYGRRTSGKVEWLWNNTDHLGNNVPDQKPARQGTFNFDLRYQGMMIADIETELHIAILPA
jgi:hypothetical protein